MKLERDRLDNKKLAQRIGRFSSTMTESGKITNKQLLPTLKNPRESTTRLTKKRMKKNYQTELQPLEFPTSNNMKRAKTTRRRHKRFSSVQNSKGDKAKDLDLAKVCKIPADREIIFQASKKMRSSTYEIEISESGQHQKMYIAAANKAKHSEHYLIELDVQKGEQILQEFKTNFNVILENLQVISRRLVLLNPNIKEEKRATTTRNCSRKRRLNKMGKKGKKVIDF